MFIYTTVKQSIIEGSDIPNNQISFKPPSGSELLLAWQISVLFGNHRNKHKTRQAYRSQLKKPQAALGVRLSKYLTATCSKASYHRQARSEVRHINLNLQIIVIPILVFVLPWLTFTDDACQLTIHSRDLERRLTNGQRYTTDPMRFGYRVLSPNNSLFAATTLDLRVVPRRARAETPLKDDTKT